MIFYWIDYEEYIDGRWSDSQTFCCIQGEDALDFCNKLIIRLPKSTFRIIKGSKIEVTPVESITKYEFK